MDNGFIIGIEYQYSGFWLNLRCKNGLKNPIKQNIPLLSHIAFADPPTKPPSSINCINKINEGEPKQWICTN
jgi:hypothetical protein